MNLTDYPTPKSDSLQPWDDVIDVEEFRDLEREEAAWRAVAENLAENLRNLAWLDGGPFSDNPSSSDRAILAFDALKSQLNEKP